MFIDCHTHVLPGMDDGPRTPEEAKELLTLLSGQGVDTLVATSHFYAHRQPVEEFRQKREEALRLLPSLTNAPVIIPAAEVYLEQGIHEFDLTPLSIGKSLCLLIELPYANYQGWMLQEVYHICLKSGLIPVFAHLNRYLSLYPEDAIQEILDFDNAVIQINHEALFQHRSLKTMLQWIKRGYPVVFGSDSHNTGSRAPDAVHAMSVLKSKLGQSWMEEADMFQRQLLLGGEIS